MNRRLLAFAGAFVCAILLAFSAKAQNEVPFGKPGSDSLKKVRILNNDHYRFEQKNDSIELTYVIGSPAAGPVRIQQEKTTIYCDSLIMNQHDQVIECFGNVHINDNDSVDIWSDYMKYWVDRKLVHFDRNVRLTDGKGTLTTENLDYDLAAHIGTYEHGGKIVNKESVLTSDRGIYYEDTKDIHFKDNVVLRDPQYDLSADSLLYNTQTQISTFITETLIQFKDSSHRTVRTREGYYDLKNRKAQFGHRSIIKDGPKQITGDNMDLDDSTGISTVTGHAIYTDTAQGVTLHADYITNNKKQNTFLATQGAVMAIKQDKDSLYVTADTLMSGRLTDFELHQRRLAFEDSLHTVYVDSLEKVQADSLHKLAVIRAHKDSLQTIQDSITDTQIKDLSDSLKAGKADSLGRKRLDSLMRMREVEDTSISKAAQDSLRILKEDSLINKSKGLKADTTQKLTHADSLKRGLKPLTAKQQRRIEKAKIEEKKEAAQQRIRDIADSTKEAARDFRRKMKARADSLRDAQSDYADSVRYAQRKAWLRARFVADSTRKKFVADSTTAIARAADSVGRIKRGDTADMVNRLDSLYAPDKYQAARLKELRRLRSDSLMIADSLSRMRIKDSLAKIPPPPATDTSMRFITGFHHVRIFSDSLQAVADSMFYSTKDSVFRLFKDPIAWGSGNYQITGDTMFVYTKNQKATRLYVFEHALAVNRVGTNFFNQLAGTTINCYFINGEVDYIRAKGSSESIYYVADDQKAYTGVNKAHADITDMIFAPKYDSAGKPNGRELNRVVLRNDAEGNMIPFKKVVFDDMRLRGFKWQESRRPKTKEEIFEPWKPDVQEQHAEQLINGQSNKKKMPQVLINNKVYNDNNAPTPKRRH